MAYTLSSIRFIYDIEQFDIDTRVIDLGMSVLQTLLPLREKGICEITEADFLDHLKKMLIANDCSEDYLISEGWSKYHPKGIEFYRKIIQTVALNFNERIYQGRCYWIAHEFSNNSLWITLNYTPRETQ